MFKRSRPAGGVPKDDGGAARPGAVRHDLAAPPHPALSPTGMRPSADARALTPAAPAVPEPGLSDRLDGPLAAALDEHDVKRRQRLLSLRVDVHNVLLEKLNLAAIDKVAPAELRAEISDIAREELASSNLVLNKREFETLVGDLVNETVGLGPLEPLLADDRITDILVNTHAQCYVERNGRLELTDIQFRDNRHLMRIINKIVAAVGRRVDESQPYVDARLADGSRVNALVPPVAVDGPLLSIRKFSKTPFTVQALIDRGAFSQEMALYLHACVRTRLNVLVSGGTGSGKTTTLNALSSFIPNTERILTIEDTAELQLQQEHVGRLESRPANIEGSGAISQRDLLRNALRMRPDRIIVGEARGDEVIDMLQAMNTGHDGSMTTIHANSPRDSLMRIENMIGMSGIELPIRALRGNISSALQVIVQVSRMSDGRRRMVSVQEVVGMEADVVTMQEIFRFDRQGTRRDGGIVGRFVATGLRSQFAERFRQWGCELPARVFNPPD